MRFISVQVFLETLREYNTVKINQVFTSEDGHSLSVRCLPGTTIFEITNIYTLEIIQSDSLDKTAEFIITFLASHDSFGDS